MTDSVAALREIQQPHRTRSQGRRTDDPADRHARRGLQNLRRRGHLARDRSRPAGLRREPRTGSQGQMAGAARRAFPVSNSTSSARCSQTRQRKPWNCSTPSTPSTAQRSPRRSQRKWPSKAAPQAFRAGEHGRGSRRRQASLRVKPQPSFTTAATNSNSRSRA